MKKSITEFEILNHGIDHSQYFQGCGVSYTKFSHVVTGCGSNAKDAFFDAMEQVAEMGFDYLSIEATEEGVKLSSEDAEAASVKNHCKKLGIWEDQDNDLGEQDLYYYLSVRWNGEKEEK